MFDGNVNRYCSLQFIYELARAAFLFLPFSSQVNPDSEVSDAGTTRPVLCDPFHPARMDHGTDGLHHCGHPPPPDPQRGVTLE